MFWSQLDIRSISIGLTKKRNCELKSIPIFQNQLQVVRRQSKKHPTPADPNYNWEETVCLNLIMQQVINWPDN